MFRVKLLNQQEGKFSISIECVSKTKNNKGMFFPFAIGNKTEERIFFFNYLKKNSPYNFGDYAIPTNTNFFNRLKERKSVERFQFYENGFESSYTVDLKTKEFAFCFLKAIKEMPNIFNVKVEFDDDCRSFFKENRIKVVNKIKNPRDTKTVFYIKTLQRNKEILGGGRLSRFFQLFPVDYNYGTLYRDKENIVFVSITDELTFPISQVYEFFITNKLNEFPFFCYSDSIHKHIITRGDFGIHCTDFFPYYLSGIAGCFSVHLDKTLNSIEYNGAYIIFNEYNSTKAKLKLPTKQSVYHRRINSNKIEQEDYKFKIDAGVEFECPCLEVYGSLDILNDYAHGDGGGIEVTSHPFPSSFEYFFQKYSSFLLGIRQEKDYKRNISGSCHIHMSIDLLSRKKETDCYSIRNNLLSFLNEMFLAYYFFDSAHPLQRRPTSYGYGYSFNKKRKVNTGDAPEYYVSKQEDRIFHTQENLPDEYGRESLVRRVEVYPNRYWFEYRGTDFIPSAILLGLKIQLLDASIKHSVNQMLNNKILPLNTYKKEELKNQVLNIGSPGEIINIVARKEAIRCLKILKPFLEDRVYKGLRAWAMYSNHIDKETGTPEWIENLEKIIVKEMGVSYITSLQKSSEFIRKKDLTDYFDISYTYNSVKKPMYAIKSSSCNFCTNKADTESTIGFGGISICSECFEAEIKRREHFKFVPKKIPKIPERTEKRIASVLKGESNG